MRSFVRAAAVFLRSEATTWLFWKTLGIPVVSAGLYIAVALLTGQYGPYIIIGAVGTFALAMLARAAIAHSEYIDAAREVMRAGRGLPPLIVPTNKVLRKGRIPQVTVTLESGTKEALLLIENTGGDGEFVADARIVKVDPGTITRTGRYRMLWRETTSHKMVKGHEHVIPADGSAKLILAAWQSGGDWGKPSLVIVGDEWSVAEFHHEPWQKRSAIVTLEVSIRSTPKLVSPVKRRYSVFLPPSSFLVAAVEDEVKTSAS
jgi:hypothetical protein